MGDVASALISRFYRPGEVIAREGMQSEGWHVLAKGACEPSATSRAKD